MASFLVATVLEHIGIARYLSTVVTVFHDVALQAILR